MMMMMTSGGSTGTANARSSGGGPLPLVQTGVHQPVDLHPDAVERGVSVRHILLNTEALVHDRHAGAGVKICYGEGELGDFLAEGFMEGEEIGRCG